MKKALFYIIGICLALVACTDETLTQEQEATQQTFNVAIGETGDARQTKAAVTMPRYMLEMYEGDLSAIPVKIDNATGTFSVTMKKGVDYLCLFWADNGADAYDASNLQAVKQADETQPGTAAYFAKVTVNSHSFNGNITLRRAVAELSFIDKYGLVQAKNTLKITYPYASAVMNLGDGTVTYTTGEAPVVRTFTDITPLATATDAFAQDFILAPVEEGKLSGLKFQLSNEKEKTIPEMVIQANYQTKVTGEYDMSLPSMSFTIDTRLNRNDYVTFILPLRATLSGYALSVDWGDEQTTDLPDGTTLDETNMTHIYAAPGAYAITLSTTQKDRTKEQMPKLQFGTNYTIENPYTLISLHTPLLNMGTDLSQCFEGCKNLSGEIPEGLFKNNTSATNFRRCFENCSGLESIPEGLFAYNKAATDFSGCFSNCAGLKAIPEGLFANNEAATNFENCFYVCSGLTEAIPERLFANNVNVTNFSSCFFACYNLSGTIPERLFENNTAVKDFYGCFYSCNHLTGSIHEGLFKNNTAVTNFTICFFCCNGLTGPIPEGLFANNAAVESFDACFAGCSGLSGTIPEELFANNKDVTKLSNCFEGCSGLTGTIPQGLFANNKKVTSFSSCFNRCSGLTGTIPEGLFANNKEATSFSYCFNDCINLEPTANIFCNEATEYETCFAGKKMHFDYCFQHCGSNTDGNGTLPALWEYTMEPDNYHKNCFNGAKATNIDKVPDDWKLEINRN